MQDEITARLYEAGVVTETFKIGFFISVDIQMVGIGAGDNRSPWTKPMERAVELIGFYNNILTLCTKDVIRAIVLRDAT